MAHELVVWLYWHWRVELFALEHLEPVEIVVIVALAAIVVMVYLLVMVIRKKSFATEAEADELVALWY